MRRGWYYLFVFALLILGAITSFVFGMGMTATDSCIFLAVVPAPAFVKARLNELAVHLCILYRGMVSYITPPVALGAFAAAALTRINALAAGREPKLLDEVGLRCGPAERRRKSFLPHGMSAHA